MSNANLLVGNTTSDNTRYCFAKPGELYLVYLPTGGSTDLDLTGVAGQFSVTWFDPRHGGAPKRGPVASVTGGRPVSLGLPPGEPSEEMAGHRPPQLIGPGGCAPAGGSFRLKPEAAEATEAAADEREWHG